MDRYIFEIFKVCHCRVFFLQRYQVEHALQTKSYALGVLGGHYIDACVCFFFHTKVNPTFIFSFMYAL